MSGLLTNPIVYRTLVETADDNYLMARASWRSHSHYTFWWLSLHALEKYLKAILLLNGRSSKGYGHDLFSLLDAVAGIDTRLQPPEFYDPLIGNLGFRRELKTDWFVQRISKLGDPNNRYGLYGFSAQTQDLTAVDQLVYWARRHCLPLLHQPSLWADYEDVDIIAQLSADPYQWRLGANLQLERTVDGGFGTEPRRNLMWINRPFDPQALMAVGRPRMAATNAAIGEWFEDLERSQPSTALRGQAREVLNWVLRNIQLNKDDAREIEEALQRYP